MKVSLIEENIGVIGEDAEGNNRRRERRGMGRSFFFFFFFSFFLGGGDFFSFCSYNIQHCFICRPSDSTVPTDAGIVPRTVATGVLAVRRSNHKARSHPRTRLDLIRY